MTSITLKGTGANNTDETFNLAYDNLGHLISKTKSDNTDTTTYTWNSRNRLSAMSRIATTTNPTTTATTTAAFKYDELGRRIERTVTSSSTNGGQPETTRFVYDGAQVVLEIRNTETASILTGLGIDEVIARYTTAGARVYLADALGSVIAMGKEDQAITTTYGYSPYGQTNQTTQVGETTANANQYTARENDNTGLYYYRARYYDPVLKRFIAEDPIGLGGGINKWAYVGGDPVSMTDPSGNASSARNSNNGGNSAQRRKDRRKNERDAPPKPINPSHTPDNNFEEAAGYYNQDPAEPLAYVCLRWNCPANPNMCSNGDIKSHNDFIPSAVDPQKPPPGCHCDENRYKPSSGPGEKGPEDYLDALRRYRESRGRR